MHFNIETSAMFEGVYNVINFLGGWLPFEYSGPRSEYMAGRESAWLGVNLNFSPAYDVWGKDVNTLMNYVCVNRDFAKLREGASRHAVICNEKGQMMADGVVIRIEENHYRCYFLAPVLQYYVETSDLDVAGKYIEDEYFYQIDGPKSLEIMEKATGCDLHDLKFAHNKKVQICGTEMTIHRLGMSGALAYEVHGAARDAETAYKRIRAVLEEYGGKPQGIRNYGIVNHTPAGYANQMQHYIYPLFNGDPGLAKFCQGKAINMPLRGSAADDENNFYLTPYDVGWGFLVNFDHDFIGKKALEKIAESPKHRIVTLEWNAEDVGDVFMSQFRGQDVDIYDPIEDHTSNSDGSYGAFVRGDYVMAEGKKIGVASGKTYAYYEKRMISLAVIDTEYAQEGKELTVLWGAEEFPKKEIRAVVAPFPYYQGEFRNETFDVEKIPHPDFKEQEIVKLDGKYDITVVVAGKENKGSFDYVTDGTVLKGTATAMGAIAEVVDGTVDGSHFYHSMRMKTPMGKMDIKVDGHLDGDTVSGTMKAMMITMHFTGKRRK
ncbi:aminomethyl transferase family protein [Candidatus Merdisoma sp. JLR.KK006]|jgi:glycine cleavage system aminomethyltransferase T|uniref:aminomethyl transferase family protein n=1 Tax=Candidatus Merdisoma sp. JLR.KK006 TaxID=3112626 RepID=UPI002FEE910E